MSEPFSSAGYDTDKSETYLSRYSRAFAPLRAKPVKLLELGVKTGGSLRMWADFFPLGEIVGLDISPATVNHPRIHVHRGYQQDAVTLDRIAGEHAPQGFDVIIDDASHVGEHTAASFAALYRRHLAPGGIYVIEDWGTGYWPAWPDGRPLRTTRANAEARLDGVRRKIRLVSRPMAARLRSRPRLYSYVKRAYWAAERPLTIVDYPSHSAGMVGFVKQLVDRTAITEAPPNKAPPDIDEMWISDGQVFCFKPKSRTE